MYHFNKTEILREVLQNRAPVHVRTLTGRIGGCKKGLKMAVCMEKCILFYWCWSQRLICSTLEATFFILLKQTAAMIFLNFFFLKSEVGWEGPPAESYCTDILICSATLHSLWGPQPERVLQFCPCGGDESASLYSWNHIL